MLGKIEIGDERIDFHDPNKELLAAKVSIQAPKVYNRGGAPRVLAYDCGMKNNIIREFLKRGVELIVVPHDADIEDFVGQFDGVFVSNGPGDPQLCTETVKSIKKVIGLEPWKGEGNQSARKDKEIPFFGICLGNQLLGLAIGATTYKMKYGNRSSNQPCIDLRTSKCYITSQNHGFAVEDNNLPDGWKVRLSRESQTTLFSLPVLLLDRSHLKS
tara:strand:+ start:1250 stop:1894 length:645 start_codon:yes stop_codon:yes gene_type:complete